MFMHYPIVDYSCLCILFIKRILFYFIWGEIGGAGYMDGCEGA